MLFQLHVEVQRNVNVCGARSASAGAGQSRLQFKQQTSKAQGDQANPHLAKDVELDLVK